MSKRKKEVPEKAQNLDFGSGQTGATVGGMLACSSGHYEYVLFIDRNSEITRDKVKELEVAGFHVVLINGDPSKAIYQASIYKS
jgi:hypothetical protein